MRKRIADIEKLGSILVLDDGSKYEVNSLDRYAVSLWIRRDEVEVLGSRITNPGRRNKIATVKKIEA